MSETPSHEPSSASEGLTEPVADPLPEPEPRHAAPPAPAPAPSKFSRWASLAALIIAVLAVAAAALGWFYPHKSASSATTYSDQQQKDAKKHICETFRIVDRAVVRNSHLKNPENGGPIGALSVATAQRFAFYGGGFRSRRAAAENRRQDQGDSRGLQVGRCAQVRPGSARHVEIG